MLEADIDKLISKIKRTNHRDGYIAYNTFKIELPSDYLIFRITRMPDCCGVVIISDIMAFYSIDYFKSLPKEIRLYILNMMKEVDKSPTYILFDKENGVIDRIFGDLLKEEYRFLNSNSNNIVKCFSIIPSNLIR